MTLDTSDTGASLLVSSAWLFLLFILHEGSSCHWKQILRSPHHGNHRNCNPCLLVDVHRSRTNVGRRSSRNFLTSLLGTICRLGSYHPTYALGYPRSCWCTI